MNPKIVMITGGAKGIGKACARAFLESGALVSLMSRTHSELESTQTEFEKEFPDKILTFKGNVADESSVEQWFDLVSKKWGTPSVLINNAAIFVSKNITEQSLEDWERVIRINLTGSFLCARAFFKSAHHQEVPRAIVNISSLAGIRGTEKFPGLSSYVASKFAVVGLTESLAVEGKKLGIRVNCIAPGAVNTEMLRQALPDLKAQAEPIDIAKICLFLADENQSHVLTGSTVEVFSNS